MPKITSSRYIEVMTPWLDKLPEYLRQCEFDPSLSCYGTGESAHWPTQSNCNVFAALAVLSEAPELPECSTTVLLKTYRTRNRLLEALPPEARVLYGANLGLDNETYSSRRDEIAALPEAYLSMLAVKK